MLEDFITVMPHSPALWELKVLLLQKRSCQFDPADSVAAVTYGKDDLDLLVSCCFFIF